MKGAPKEQGVLGRFLTPEAYGLAARGGPHDLRARDCQSAGAMSFALDDWVEPAHVSFADFSNRSLKISEKKFLIRFSA